MEPRTSDHRRLPHVLAAVGLASLWIAACEKQPAPTTSPTRDASAPRGERPAVEPPTPERPAVEPPAPSVKRFAEMNEPEKREHMSKVVAPRMRTLFEAADASRWTGLNCQKCHGYAIPGTPMQRPQHTLPKLTLSGDGLQRLRTKQPEVTKFMVEIVVPAMAEAMGEKPFDPATGEGFGCAGCHAVD